MTGSSLATRNLNNSQPHSLGVVKWKEHHACKQTVDSISCCGWNHSAWKQCSNEPWTSEPEILGYRSGSAAYWLWHWTSCPWIFILHVNNVHNNNCQPLRIALSIPCQGNGLVRHTLVEKLHQRAPGSTAKFIGHTKNVFARRLTLDPSTRDRSVPILGWPTAAKLWQTRACVNEDLFVTCAALCSHPLRHR